MPWQLSGNGRSGWSTKLIRGLKAEAAAGFQSRRERCRESTPVTPQYAAFSTYKAAGVHRQRRRLWCVVRKRPCAAAAPTDTQLGIIMAAGKTPEYVGSVAALKQALGSLGWKEGDNLRIEDRWSAGSDDAARSAAQEVIKSNPDLVL